MRTLDFYRCALGICAAAAMFAGCGGSQPPVGAPGAMPQSQAVATHAAHGTSWMAPQATKIKELLYVSDGATSNVYVYDYKSGASVGMLTGFEKPYGQCVDKKGDIWITNYTSANAIIVEYAHGGTQPIRTLSINDNSLGCSIDPTTRNLAVSSKATNSGGPGAIQVFKHASGTPTNYPGSGGCSALWPPGYDNKGNLYVEAENGNYLANVCELPAGGRTLGLVSFNRALAFPTSVMWDGKYIALGAQYYKDGAYKTTAIFQAAPSGSGGLTFVGMTILTNACRRHPYVDLPLPFIVGRTNTPVNQEQGKVVVGGDYPCRSVYRDFAFWRYPRGGNHFRELNSAPPGPTGESVSILPGS
jgi:hypothetical protein